MISKEQLILELEKRSIPTNFFIIKKQTIIEYNDFFKIDLNKDFKIYLIHTIEEMNIATGRKNEKWLKGYTCGPEKQIFIFDPDHYLKETGQKIINLEKLIKHEIAHIYFGEITHSHHPNWLNEGLAEYLSKKEKQSIDLNEIVNCIDYYNSFSVEQYARSYLLVDLLINKFGKDKLLSLIKSHKNKEEFYKFFKETYGFDLTEENLILNLK